MTVIVGLVAEDGTVIIGGDSLASYGTEYVQRRADKKVFAIGDYVFGFCQSFRMGQLLESTFTPPLPGEGEDLSTFMRTRFVEAVKSAFRAGGYGHQSDGDSHSHHSSFMVGFRGRLFSVEGDYQVAESLDPFDAIGAGTRVAMGALFATNGLGLEPAARVMLALGAAAEYTPTVGGPFSIGKTDPWPKS